MCKIIVRNSEKMRKEIRDQRFTGERALFKSEGLDIYDSIFDDGESPLKESRDISLTGCMLKWKYPLWYCENVEVKNSAIFANGRAGIWYTNNISISDTLIEAPKTFRRSAGIRLKNVDMPNASETLWNCVDVQLDNVSAKGDYFAMNLFGARIDNFRLSGNYCFDGAENIEIYNSKLLSKDSFWNSRKVTVKNSLISGEYLGWNSEDLTFEDCVIESLQGLCYIDRLTMKNCKLINTTLAFEYSTVDADITGSVESVLNPKSGTIRADRIGTLILEKDKIDPSKTTIICRAD